MQSATYRWGTDAQQFIVGPDGQSIPADPNNVHYAALLGSGVEIADYVPPPPNADDVRREASRRMQALVGARDSCHLEIVIANATREAVRLQNIVIGGGTWTPAQAARASELVAADTAIEEIRAASNVLEPNPPPDYTADTHWP